MFLKQLPIFTKVKLCLVIVLLVTSVPSFAKTSDQYDSIILKQAVKQKLDPAFVKAVIRAESNYDHLAVSHAKAEGLMQLIPATAERFNVKDSFDPEQNIMGGTKYLRWLSKRFNGDMRLTLAGYNAGEGNVDKYNGIPPFRETQNYVKKVMRFYREFKGLPPIQERKFRRNQKDIRQIAINKNKALIKKNQMLRAINLLALNRRDKSKSKTAPTLEISRVNEAVNTIGAVHRVTSLTLVNTDRPLPGYSRITATRRLQ